MEILNWSERCFLRSLLVQGINQTWGQNTNGIEELVDGALMLPKPIPQTHNHVGERAGNAVLTFSFTFGTIITRFSSPPKAGSEASLAVSGLLGQSFPLCSFSASPQSLKKKKKKKCPSLNNKVYGPLACKLSQGFGMHPWKGGELLNAGVGFHVRASRWQGG